MVSVILKMAFDFAEKKDAPRETVTYQRNGLWYVQKSGPSHSNVFLVTNYDDAGLEWLKAREVEKEDFNER